MTKKNKKPNTKKKSTFRFDLGLFLLISGALANVTIWIGAFVAIESQGFIGEWVRTVLLPILGGISGLAMGITVTVGLVYVIAKLGGLKPTIEHKVRGKDEYKSVPNIRFYGAWVAIIILMGISPALLAPYVYMMVSGKKSLFDVLGENWAGLWSAGRILTSDLALAALAMVHGGPVAAIAGSAQQSVSKPVSAGSTGSTKDGSSSKTVSGRSAKDNRPLKFECPHAGTGCEVTKPTQQAINAHAGRCKFKPTISMPKEEAKV